MVAAASQEPDGKMDLETNWLTKEAYDRNPWFQFVSWKSGQNSTQWDIIPGPECMLQLKGQREAGRICWRYDGEVWNKKLRSLKFEIRRMGQITGLKIEKLGSRKSIWLN